MIIILIAFVKTFVIKKKRFLLILRLENLHNLYFNLNSFFSSASYKNVIQGWRNLSSMWYAWSITQISTKQSTETKNFENFSSVCTCVFLMRQLWLSNVWFTFSSTVCIVHVHYFLCFHIVLRLFCKIIISGLTVVH